jgi:hypothetical protein
MSEDSNKFDPDLPCTATLRRVLPAIRDRASVADLLFLEHWEMCPLPGAAAALRVSQIRRANPRLAAAIRAEVAGRLGEVAGT